jgi:hypothetical protein
MAWQCANREHEVVTVTDLAAWEIERFIALRRHRDIARSAPIDDALPK